MSAQGKRRTGAKWKRNVKSVLILVLVVVVLIVIFQNVENDDFQVLFWKATLPKVLFLLIAFAAGALVGALLSHLLRGKRA